MTYKCPRCHAGVILAHRPESVPRCMCGLVVDPDTGRRKARRPPIDMVEVDA